MQDLVEGQQVICKHKNGRYYQAEVVELTKATFYEVAFDDGSFSDNLFPEDITVSIKCTVTVNHYVYCFAYCLPSLFCK